MKFKCKRCGHKWISQLSTRPPVVCPKCKSYKYDEPRKKEKVIAER